MAVMRHIDIHPSGPSPHSYHRLRMTPLWEPDRILRELASEQRWMAYMELLQVSQLYM